MSRLLAVDPNVVPGKARELLEGGVAQQAADVVVDFARVPPFAGESSS